MGRKRDKKKHVPIIAGLKQGKTIDEIMENVEVIRIPSPADNLSNTLKDIFNSEDHFRIQAQNNKGWDKLMAEGKKVAQLVDSARVDEGTESSNQ